MSVFDTLAPGVGGVLFPGLTDDPKKKEKEEQASKEKTERSEDSEPDVK